MLGELLFESGLGKSALLTSRWPRIRRGEPMAAIELLGRAGLVRPKKIDSKGATVGGFVSLLDSCLQRVDLLAKGP